MATPNYGYEKRQKELAKKRKKEDKLREKAQRKQGGSSDGDSAASYVDPTPAPGDRAPGSPMSS
ncbi:MAG: hypothetical protein R3E92_04550 [Burkholderiaceae bacterium]|nr:hypothetical protein [Rhodoferax sp.]MCZ4314991.1 hypothetical protein [Comamonadaceae bacterium G21597-S1]MCB2042539.1 hypothetical protein [Rhodoferax sp.]MCP5260520.1 hypothetical protein [Rhodoferax sp.]MCW5628037.1 hypothetical protein [Rhodoferax sp.]